MAQKFRNIGGIESSDALASYTDGDGAYMDFDTGAGNARFGAKGGAGANRGTLIQTLLAGVVKTAITIAASGLTITLLAGSTLAAQAVTATSLTVGDGVTAVDVQPRINVKSGNTAAIQTQVAGSTKWTFGMSVSSSSLQWEIYNAATAAIALSIDPTSSVVTLPHGLTVSAGGITSSIARSNTPGGGAFFLTPSGGTTQYSLRHDSTSNALILDYYNGSAWVALWSFIGSSGYLGIGATPSTFLAVSGSIANQIATFKNTEPTNPYGVQIYYTAAAPNDTSHEFVRLDDSAVTRGAWRANGGIANYSANNVNLSDARSKKPGWTPLAYDFDTFERISLVRYQYKDQTHPYDNFGVIADELEHVDDHFVDEFEFGPDKAMRKMVFEHDLFYAHMSVTQQLQRRVRTLEAQLSQLSR